MLLVSESKLLDIVWSKAVQQQPQTSPNTTYFEDFSKQQIIKYSPVLLLLTILLWLTTLNIINAPCE